MKLQKSRSYWIDWPDDEDGAKVKIRVFTDGDIQDISDRSHTQCIVENEKGQMVVEMRVNSRIDRELTLDKAIEEWEGFFGANGKPMECNKKNKFRFSRTNGFMEKFRKCRETAQRLHEEREKGEEKN